MSRPHLRQGAAFAALVFSFAVVMLGTTMPTPMYPLYQAKLGFSVEMLTVIYAVYAVGVLAALLALGRWSDSLGRRPMLAVGLLFAAVSGVFFLASGGVWQLLVGRVFSGLSAGIFTGTATAAVIEIAPRSWQNRAAYVATGANIGGLGLGPLLAGLAVQYLPWPLHLDFAVHIGLMAIAAVLVALCPETVNVQPGARPRMQRLAVPAQVRATFVSASIAGFAGFAVLGLFTALAPRLLSDVLGVRNHAVAGLVVFLVFAASTVAQIVLRNMTQRRAVNLGCAGLVVGTLLIALALWQASMLALIAGAIIAGAGQGTSFSKGLAAITEQVDPERKAEVTSTFFVVLYVALSLPVLGLGFAVQAFGITAAGIAFALGVAALALLALGALTRTGARRSQPV
ncbi:MAG: MFS transporter [Actinomycetota bacterium]|nr:MFS transporter [Actinomycetota bacterium]